MPPQLPCPGQACSAIRARTSSSGSAGGLECGDEVDPRTRLRISAWPDRSVRQQHRGSVVLEEGGKGADRRLVARHDGNQARHIVRGQVHGRCVVDQFPADQGVPHLGSPIELAVRNAERVGWRDQAHRQIFAGDTPRHRSLNGRYLGLDTQIALAVTKVADDGPDRVMDLPDVLAQKGRRPDLLNIPAGVRRPQPGGVARIGRAGSVHECSHAQNRTAGGSLTGPARRTGRRFSGRRASRRRGRPRAGSRALPRAPACGSRARDRPA